MILEKDFEDFVKYLNKHAVEYMVVGVVQDFGLKSQGLTKRDFLTPGGITQIGYPPLRIDILNEVDGVSFSDAFQNRKSIEEGGLTIWYIGRDDLIKNKQASGRKQDIADILELKNPAQLKKDKGKEINAD